MGGLKAFRNEQTELKTGWQPFCEKCFSPIRCILFSTTFPKKEIIKLPEDSRSFSPSFFLYPTKAGRRAGNSLAFVFLSQDLNFLERKCRAFNYFLPTAQSNILSVQLNV